VAVKYTHRTFHELPRDLFQNQSKLRKLELDGTQLDILPKITKKKSKGTIQVHHSEILSDAFVDLSSISSNIEKQFYCIIQNSSVNFGNGWFFATF